ncbi:hypothetical protein IGI04_031049 [Brassica rapa subsp. trilocularis]|uniref:Uncharacterized protein n=1 Tax=Brassica rapa subsp. trilocularis TaxID=1813537 RepID=A0ABQ7LSH7_BRACM|nr:hypothetical protein IGI04_031049 [Brassica rapa subsp. trilocularis]
MFRWTENKDPRGFAAARTNAAVPTSPSLQNNTGNQPSVHPDPPELTDSTPSPPPNVFNTSEPNFGEHQSTDRDLIRPHSSQSPRGRLCVNHHR